MAGARKKCLYPSDGTRSGGGAGAAFSCGCTIERATRLRPARARMNVERAPGTRPASRARVSTESRDRAADAGDELSRITSELARADATRRTGGGASRRESNAIERLDALGCSPPYGINAAERRLGARPGGPLSCSLRGCVRARRRGTACRGGCRWSRRVGGKASGVLRERSASRRDRGRRGWQRRLSGRHGRTGGEPGWNGRLRARRARRRSRSVGGRRRRHRRGARHAAARQSVRTG